MNCGSSSRKNFIILEKFKMSSLSRGVFLARSATRFRAAGRPLVRAEMENAPGQVNTLSKNLTAKKYG